MTVRRYTLEEAQLELQRRECAARGHYFDIVSVGLTPLRLVCACGASFNVVKGDA